MNSKAPRGHLKTGLLSFLLICAFFSSSAIASGVSGGSVVEDFSSIDHADFANTTGLWNIETRAAEAMRVADADASRPILFGDGSDGVLNSSTGYTFDTDAHPNGFNFVSVAITGGTITVTGKNPLVIRSLTTVNITPLLSVAGGDGLPDGISAGLRGGIARACSSVAGAGGNATLTIGSPGVTGKNSDGSDDANAKGGLGVSPPATASAGDGWAGSSPRIVTGDDFDTPTWFVCGSGSGGGGGFADGANYVTGGGGGAAGGVVRVVAAGNVSVGAIDAHGGNGGNGTNATASSFCSGVGSGAPGGNVWLQSLRTASSGAPVLSGGFPGAVGTGCVSLLMPGPDGLSRVDSMPGGRPVWGSGNRDTDKVLPGKTYVIQSKAYDLGTNNPAFMDPAQVTSVANGGTISAEFAASTDGTAFTAFTPALSSLSNHGYRYLKFKLTIATASSAGPSPKVTLVSIPFHELEYTVSGGCVFGTTDPHHGRPSNPWSGPLSMVPWALLWVLGRHFSCYWRMRIER